MDVCVCVVFNHWHRQLWQELGGKQHTKHRSVTQWKWNKKVLCTVTWPMTWSVHDHCVGMTAEWIIMMSSRGRRWTSSSTAAPTFAVQMYFPFSLLVCCRVIIWEWRAVWWDKTLVDGTVCFLLRSLPSGHGHPIQGMWLSPCQQATKLEEVGGLLSLQQSQVCGCCIHSSIFNVVAGWASNS